MFSQVKQEKNNPRGTLLPDHLTKWVLNIFILMQSLSHFSCLCLWCCCLLVLFTLPLSARHLPTFLRMTEQVPERRSEPFHQPTTGVCRWDLFLSALKNNTLIKGRVGPQSGIERLWAGWEKVVLLSLCLSCLMLVIAENEETRLKKKKLFRSCSLFGQ